jgi:hypothetical protein
VPQSNQTARPAPETRSRPGASPPRSLVRAHIRNADGAHLKTRTLVFSPEKISGAVVLMREVTTPAQAWRCISYAETWFDTKVLFFEAESWMVIYRKRQTNPSERGRTLV